MLLELGTTAGALTGAFLAGVVGGRWLFVIFGLVLGYSALAMLRKRKRGAAADVPPDRLADRLRLHGTYYDEAEGREIAYRVTHTPLGLCLMYVAGVVSGLLGIGSGALKVPAMDLAMRLPIKASTATSNFMIGVTAAASAGVYFARGDINPFIAALAGRVGSNEALALFKAADLGMLASLYALWKSTRWDSIVVLVLMTCTFEYAQIVWANYQG